MSFCSHFLLRHLQQLRFVWDSLNLKLFSRHVEVQVPRRHGERLMPSKIPQAFQADTGQSPAESRTCDGCNATRNLQCP